MNRKYFSNKNLSLADEEELDCIPIIGLTVGMKVVALDKPWEESSFPFRELIIKSQQDIELLRDECRNVYVSRDDDSSGMVIASGKSGKVVRKHDWG